MPSKPTSPPPHNQNLYQNQNHLPFPAILSYTTTPPSLEPSPPSSPISTTPASASSPSPSPSPPSSLSGPMISRPEPSKPATSSTSSAPRDSPSTSHVSLPAFDHRASTMARVSQLGKLPENLELKIDTNKSSVRAVYDYFSEKLAGEASLEDLVGLLSNEDSERLATVLRYIEDADLRRWEMPDAEAFKIGLRDERAKLNSVTNPCVFDQLLEFDYRDLIAKGKYCISSRRDAASELMGKAFKIRLGRGLYGECLAIRDDENSNLSHEIGVELSRRSAAAGLRPIGAVIFMQRGNLKMCLRSTDSATDTSEIAKAYGGGGKSGSSSFIIRMDEYNHWTSVNSL